MKVREKESGLRDLEELGINTEKCAHLFKPGFKILPVTDSKTGKVFTFEYPATELESGAEEFICNLQLFKGFLDYHLDKGIYSVRENMWGYFRYSEISSNTDIIARPEPETSVYYLDDFECFRNSRKSNLESLLKIARQKRESSLLFETSTLINTKIGKSGLELIPIVYRPICNSIVHLGMSYEIKMRDPKNFECFKEHYDITPEFLDYLKTVHKVITGRDYDPQQGNVPLEISVNEPGFDELLNEFDEIKAMKDKKITTRFVHIEFSEQENPLKKGDMRFVSHHLDGALFNYTFDKLRRRMFSYYDPSGRVSSNNGEYIKVFRIDVDPEFAFPIFRVNAHPRTFDMIDLVDSYFGRFSY